MNRQTPHKDNRQNGEPGKPYAGAQKTDLESARSLSKRIKTVLRKCISNVIKRDGCLNAAIPFL